MNSNIIIKNNLQLGKYKNSNLKKNCNLVSDSLNLIYKDLDFEENAYHQFSKKFKYNFKPSDLNQFKKFENIILIGMGGSSLGAKSIYSFLKYKIKKNFIFFDDLDSFKLEKINKNKVILKSLFLIISKSGNTLETLVNINSLKKVKFTKKNTIIISENKNNALNIFARQKKIPIIFHKNYIGGRYSVFSEVGMLPAYLMGLNIKDFKKNINSFFLKNRSFLSKSIAEMGNYYLKNKKSSLIFFNYYSPLNNFVFWAQQLIAESLGKKGLGILPVFSKAPRDHHSLLQLYLDGPRDKIFIILSNKEDKNLKYKKNLFSKTHNYIGKKTVSTVLNSQKKAFIKVLRKKKIPFREIIMKSITESSLGELLTYFIIETTMIGKMLNINPFDQPAVEDVKIFTKKNLS